HPLRILSYLRPLVDLTLLFVIIHSLLFIVFLINNTPPTEIYTLSLHDALPISESCRLSCIWYTCTICAFECNYNDGLATYIYTRSEEHTSELQTRFDLVCRLLLEKKKKQKREGNYDDLIKALLI